MYLARKPKKQIDEGSSLPPLTLSPEESVTETYDDVEISITETPKPESIEDKIVQAMAYALSEIERCNDYIYAKADLDRRFTVYRDELYEYRYKLRQLSLRDDYPYIDEKIMPQLPDYIKDV